VKKIIEKNGGEITLQSAKGEGTTFSFSLKKNYGAI
jgi:signal transduction histidine kinase